MKARIVFAFLALCLPAAAHEAPTGWSYDMACCGGQDCQQVKDSDIRETPQGYYIIVSKELLLYNDKRLKDSHDEFFHRCSLLGRPETRTLCLYKPDRGY